MISDRHSTVRGRGGRRMLAPLAVAALAAALLAGCGDDAADDPATDPATTSSEAPDAGATTEAPASDDTTDEATGTAEEPTDSDATDDADDDGSGGDEGGSGGEETDDSPAGENLFEGTWRFGHDSKVLDAEELADLLETEAASRGPEEMSLSVECGDGVDTVAGDDTAECIAYADEGVEHLWAISVGPADAGLVIEVENIG